MIKTVLIGKYGEWLAARYLKKAGYAILERGYKNNLGEIDIIARDGGQMVFVEVKTRVSDEFGDPCQAIDYRKRRKIINTALVYLKKHGDTTSVRFDFVGVRLWAAGAMNDKIEHRKDIFEL
ncbi:MAG: YraN family protein [Candidatus Magnetominusculus sp. LBB02]|nr:YraN family protein [Candidatus Magnetominusculus sp. LBB02]